MRQMMGRLSQVSASPKAVHDPSAPQVHTRAQTASGRLRRPSLLIDPKSLAAAVDDKTQSKKDVKSMFQTARRRATEKLEALTGIPQRPLTADEKSDRVLRSMGMGTLEQMRGEAEKEKQLRMLSNPDPNSKGASGVPKAEARPTAGFSRSLRRNSMVRTAPPGMKASNPQAEYNADALKVQLLAGSVARMSKFLVKGARSGKIADVVVALEGGGDPNQRDSHGMTPLMYAAIKNNLDCLKCLVGHGGDVNQQSSGGVTALHYAAAHNHVGALHYLLELRRGFEDARSDTYGKAVAPRVCQPNLKTVSGFTPLHTAVVANHIEAVEVLVSCPSVEIEAFDNEHWTPMHHACRLGDRDMVRLLVNNGAQIRSLDQKNLTPMDIAQIRGHDHIFQFLYNQTDHATHTKYGMSQPPWTDPKDMIWSNAPQPALADEYTLTKKFFQPCNDKSKMRGKDKKLLYSTEFVSQMELDLAAQGKALKKKRKKKKAKVLRTKVRRASLLAAAGVDLSQDPTLKAEGLDKLLKNVRFTTAAAAEAAMKEAAQGSAGRGGHKDHLFAKPKDPWAERLKRERKARKTQAKKTKHLVLKQ